MIRLIGQRLTDGSGQVSDSRSHTTIPILIAIGSTVARKTFIFILLLLVHSPGPSHILLPAQVPHYYGCITQLATSTASLFLATLTYMRKSRKKLLMRRLIDYAITQTVNLQ